MSFAHVPAVRRRHTALIFAAVLLILLRVAFGLAYSIATPAWESYDEPAHFAYAAQITQTGTLPADTDPIPNPERIQPPLYYLALAAFLKLTNSPVANFAYPEQNPYFYYGTSGVNYAIHTLNPTPEQREVETSLRFVRFITLLFSLIGVAFTIQLGRRVFPRRPGAAFIVGLLFALWPQLIFNSSVVTNDAPAAVFGAIITWQLFGFRRGRDSFRRLAVCLLALAVGAVFKLNVLLLFAPLVVVIVLTGSRRFILIALLNVALLVAGVFLALESLPNVLVPIFAGFWGGTSMLGSIRAQLEWDNAPIFIRDALFYVRDSSFALFGWGNVPLPGWIDMVWRLTLTVTGLGLVFYIVRGFARWHERPIQRKQFVIAAATVAGVLGGALALSLAYASTHLSTGRYLLPALPAFLLLFVTGWLALRLGWLLRMAAAGMVLLSIAIPPAVLAPVYAIPPEVRIADIPNKGHIELAPGVVFMGWDIPDQVITPGQEFQFYLYWQAAYSLPLRYFFKIELIGADGLGYGILDTIPGEGNYLATDWQPRRTFRDHYKLRVRGDYPAPSIGRLRVTVLPNTGEYPYTEFGEIAIHNREQPMPPISIEKAARFRDALALRGASFEFFGQTRLQVYLTWQALQKMQPGTVFLHLLCDKPCPGALVAQRDTQPRDGGYPFQWWLPGEIIADTYDIPLPENIAAGQYPLRVGVYDTVTPERLRWTVDYLGNADDGLLVAWLIVDENNQRRISVIYPR